MTRKTAAMSEPALAKRIELWPIGRLKPYERNARTHDAAQVAKIAASITEFGFTNPILVDSEDGIIAGHGRLMAAKEMGLADVPVIVLDHLTDEQRRAYILADNRLALDAGWDEALLASELADLQADGFDLELTGFNEDELARLLDDEDGAGVDEDEPPELAERAVTQTGDVWIMGRHRLVCGDSTSDADVLKLLGNARADLVVCSIGFTDPPWNVGYGGHPTKGAGREILNDNLPEADWEKFVVGFTGTLFSATAPGAPVYVVMGSQEWPTVDRHLRDAGFHWSSTIVWVKDRFVLTRKDYHSQFEPIWYGWNGAAARIRPVEDRAQSDVWEFPRPKVSELHPMTKPVELIERAITNSSKKWDVVLDLFGGSGSTLIACEKTFRSARLIEMDQRYCDVIVRRWQQFSGQSAVLEATRQTFSVVEDRRAAANDNNPTE